MGKPFRTTTGTIVRAWQWALGDLPRFAADPIGVTEQLTIGRDRPATLRLGPTRAHLVATASGMRHVLLDHREHYGKGQEQARLRSVLGDGLITSSGPRWQAARDALKTAFSGASMQAGIDQALATLQPATAELAERGLCEVDLHPLMGRMTIRMVVAALFQAEIGDQEADEIYAAASLAHGRITESMWRIVDPDMVLPTRKQRAFKAAVRTLRRHVVRFISAGAGPLCSALAPLAAERGEQVLHDEATTLLIAGFETTTTAASWMIYMLACRPDLQDWIRGEIDNPQDLCAATVRGLARTRAFVQEVLRLYPSTWWLARRALRDDVIGGTRIAAGDAVLLSFWSLHRQPSSWVDPLRFDPGRFFGPGERDRFTYLPFGLGPRTCIGAQLALAELTGVAAMITGAFDLTPLSGDIAHLRAQAGVTLAPPPAGLQIRLATRQKKMAA